MSDEAHAIEQFYGVYLLYCLNPMYKGRTYIGYTVDPNRRIKQHNKGKKAGGAWKTSNRGPWSMVMIVHGFPNDIAALRFEWAWQHPKRSRRLNHIARKKPRESGYDYCLRILAEMLRVGPWNRLPLTIRWLNEDFARDFPGDKLPPMHMPICYGHVVSKKRASKASEKAEGGSDNETLEPCTLCFEIINEKAMTCLNPSCDLVAHVICLSRLFMESGEYVPVEGKCPKCDETFLWGDLVQKYKGYHGNLNVIINTNDFEGSDSE